LFPAVHRSIGTSLVRAALYLGVAAALGCGAGGGTAATLPPGQPTSAPPGDLVLYVSLPGGDRVVGYRLGTDGLMPRNPFTSINLENPRDIALGDGVLYVAMEDRAVALTLGSNGALPALPSSQTDPLAEAEAVDLLLFDDVLYIAFEGFGRVYAFALESGGALPPEPISTSGTATSDYRTMTAADGFLYAASLGGTQIDTYVIQPDGSLPVEPEPQEPPTEIFRPADMFVNDGKLYAIEQSRARIEQFDIRANGLLPDEADTFTSEIQRYARMVLDGDRLYASGFNLGRIDLFLLLPDGSFAEEPPFGHTVSDAETSPVGIVLNDGILYVAQSGVGRIDAYIINADGTPADFPSSSTDAIAESFPQDLALATFPD
jgi:hypothetical protein